MKLQLGAHTPTTTFGGSQDLRMKKDFIKVFIFAYLLCFSVDVFGQQAIEMNNNVTANDRDPNNIKMVLDTPKAITQSTLPYSEFIVGAFGALMGGLCTYLVGKHQRNLEKREEARKRIIRRLIHLYMLHCALLDSHSEDIKKIVKSKIPLVAYEAIDDLLYAEWAGCTELLWRIATGGDLREYALTRDLLWQMLESVLSKSNPEMLNTLRNIHKTQRDLKEIAADIEETLKMVKRRRNITI